MFDSYHDRNGMSGDRVRASGFVMQFAQAHCARATARPLLPLSLLLKPRLSTAVPANERNAATQSTGELAVGPDRTFETARMPFRALPSDYVSRSPKNLETFQKMIATDITRLSIPQLRFAFRLMVECGYFARAWQTYERLCERKMIHHLHQEDHIVFIMLIKQTHVPESIAKMKQVLKTCRDVGFMPSPLMYSTVALEMARLNWHDELEEFWQFMKRHDVRPNDYAYMAFIQSAYKQRMFEAAEQRYLEGMKKIQLAKGRNRLRKAMIDAYSRWPRPDKAEELFKVYVREETVPRNITRAYNALMSAYALVSDYEKAFQVYETLKRQGLPSDCRTYGTLAFCYLLKGQEASFLHYYKEACSLANSGAMGSVATESIRFFCSKKEVDKAEALLKIYKDARVRFLRLPFNPYLPLMRFYCEMGEYNKMRRVFDESHAEGAIKLNEEAVLEMAVGHLIFKRRDRAVRLLKEAGLMGLHPTGRFFDCGKQLVSAAREAGLAVGDTLPRPNRARNDFSSYFGDVDYLVRNHRID